MDLQFPYNTHSTSRPRGWILSNSWSYIWRAAGHGPRISVIFTLCEWYPFICVVKNQAFCRRGLLYREINSSSDATTLKSDLDALCRWESEWEMKFNSDKCFVMHMTTKRNPVIHQYNINDKPLQTTSSHPYLGLILSSDCRWSDHINKITTNAKQTTGIIRRNFKSCSSKIKSRLYQSLVRPKLEFADGLHSQKKNENNLKVSRDMLPGCVVTTTPGLPVSQPWWKTLNGLY